MPPAKKGSGQIADKATTTAALSEQPDAPLNDAQSFEDELASLEKLVEHLEHGDIPLAEAVKAYEQGLKHAQSCENLLAEAQKRLDELTDSDTQDIREASVE